MEPLCAVYRPAWGPALERQLARGDHRALGFHPDARVRTLSLEHVRRFGDPEVLFFQRQRAGRPDTGGGAVAATRMISIIGRKNAGKTTLLVALSSELTRRKLRVMTIKHGSHAADMDQHGKDTWRHWHEGKADRVLMEAPGQRVLFERTAEEMDPMSLARRYLDGADIVLVEGFERALLPKIEVYRGGAAPEPIFDPLTHNPADWVAMLTDDLKYRAPFPVFRFSDTAWLVTLGNLAWERARVLAP